MINLEVSKCLIQSGLSNMINKQKLVSMKSWSKKHVIPTRGRESLPKKGSTIPNIYIYIYVYVHISTKGSFHCSCHGPIVVSLISHPNEAFRQDSGTGCHMPLLKTAHLALCIGGSSYYLHLATRGNQKKTSTKTSRQADWPTAKTKTHVKHNKKYI